MEFYERVSGARMHAAYIRVGGVSLDLPNGILNDLYLFHSQFTSRINEIEELLTYNRIWNQRLKNIGYVNKNIAETLAFSGVMQRGSGLKIDLRKNYPYEIYDILDFSIPIGSKGDCFDRYLCRMEEMRQSLKIIGHIIENIPNGPVKTDNQKIVNFSRKQIKKSMEATIQNFKLHAMGYVVPENHLYTSIEAPKGEFGVYLAANNHTRPYRCKIKAPGLLHLQGLEYLAKNHLIADVVALIGTKDIVFGEVDR
jgi:NADH dehydrogenase (ubiquinone) Fe-S protein 2